MLDAWTVLDVSDWIPVRTDNRGVREKIWIKDSSDQDWLRKTPRTSRPYEPSIESIALRLARATGVDAAESSVCQWEDRAGLTRGVVVRRFGQGVDEELVHGAELLRGADEFYNPENKTLHKPGTIRSVLRCEDSSRGSCMLPRMFDMLVFDAWIGNGDRHPENWATYRSRKGLRLAPMYDPAACLGSELLDKHNLLAVAGPDARKLQEYMRNCPSGFGDGVGLIKMDRLVSELHSWPEWQRAAPLIARFSQVFHTDFEEFLSKIEDTWLSQPRKKLMQAILLKRLEWLEAMLK